MTIPDAVFAFVFCVLVLAVVLLAFALRLTRQALAAAERSARDWQAEAREQEANAGYWHLRFREAFTGRSRRPAELDDADRAPTWRTPHA